MTIRDEELLTRLRSLSSLARQSPEDLVGPAETGAEEALCLLGLDEDDLSPQARAVLLRLIEDVAGLREQLSVSLARLAEAERQANEDSLAPVSNRRAFLRHLARSIGFVERYGAASSLLYFDLNDLKAINDNHGHAAGDAALIHVAYVLRGHTRNSDVVGRLGGDEFGVLLTHADADAAAQKAAALADAVAGKELVWQGRVIPVHVAYGAHGLEPGEDPQEALAAADRAMYAQKRRGSDRRGEHRGPPSR